MPVPDLHGPDELKTLVEEGLERIDLWPELHGQATSVRYALEVGGKRVRPVIALAVGEALGAPVEQVSTGEGGSPERASELLGELSELAKAGEEELTRAQRAAEADAGA